VYRASEGAEGARGRERDGGRGRVGAGNGRAGGKRAREREPGTTVGALGGGLRASGVLKALLTAPWIARRTLPSELTCARTHARAPPPPPLRSRPLNASRAVGPRVRALRRPSHAAPRRARRAPRDGNARPCARKCVGQSTAMYAVRYESVRIGKALCSASPKAR
jgi:hypothetical protein